MAKPEWNKRERGAALHGFLQAKMREERSGRDGKDMGIYKLKT
jgi:hypothetical protein